MQVWRSNIALISDPLAEPSRIPQRQTFSSLNRDLCSSEVYLEEEKERQKEKEERDRKGRQTKRKRGIPPRVLRKKPL